MVVMPHEPPCLDSAAPLLFTCRCCLGLSISAIPSRCRQCDVVASAVLLKWAVQRWVVQQRRLVGGVASGEPRGTLGTSRLVGLELESRNGREVNSGRESYQPQYDVLLSPLAMCCC